MTKGARDGRGEIFLPRHTCSRSQGQGPKHALRLVRLSPTQTKRVAHETLRTVLVAGIPLGGLLNATHFIKLQKNTEQKRAAVID
ncbi:hypothetical protein QTP88_003072 [Uroleucon formosanum]